MPARDDGVSEREGFWEPGVMVEYHNKKRKRGSFLLEVILSIFEIS